MNITKVSIENYRSIKEFTWDLLSPEGGIFHVIGSVGAGKSNLFRAAFWGLTGKEPRKRFKVKSLEPTHQPSTQTSVSVTYTHRRQEFTTTRLLKKGHATSLSTFCGDTPVGPVDSMAHQQWLEKSFGASESVLSQTLLFCKGKFENIGYRTPAEMNEYFETAIGFCFDDAMAKGRSLVREYRDKVARCEVALAAAKRRISDISDHATTLKMTWRDFTSLQETEQRTITDAEAKLAQIFCANSDDFQKLKSDIEAARAQVYSLAGRLQLAEQDKCPTCGHPTKGSPDQLASMKKKISKLQDEISEMNAKLNQWQADGQAAAILKNTISGAEGRIKLQMSRRADLHSQATALLARLETARNALSNAQKYRARARARLATVEASMGVLPHIRKAAVSSMVDNLNTSFPTHLESLTGGYITGRIQENLTVDVSTLDGASYDDLSDGEMTLVDLAWMLAYRETCMTVMGLTEYSRVLFIDERLSHLYHAVLVPAMEALRAWALQTKTTIFIVHHGDLPHHVVDGRLLVTKEAGNTIISREAAQ